MKQEIEKLLVEIAEDRRGYLSHADFAFHHDDLENQWFSKGAAFECENIERKVFAILTAWKNSNPV